MKRGYGLIWMSAGNSYFKEEIILKLLRFGSKNFNEIIILSPDEPAEHTYLALGYEEKNAKRKAKLNSNLLKNRAKRAIEILKKEGNKTNFKIIEWTNEINKQKNYQEELIKIQKLYNSNISFQKDTKEITKKVMENKSITNQNINIDEGVKYLIKELAFVIVTPIIYNTHHVTYIYHNEWTIFQKLIDGEYDGKQRNNLSFMLSNIK